MDKTKVHELAKKLGLSSKDIISKATELNIDVKSHLSSLNEEDVVKIEKEIKNKTSKESKKETKDKIEKIGKSKKDKVEKPDKKSGTKKEETTDKKETKQPKKDKNEAPVIIRREVIVSEEELIQKENDDKIKKQEERKGSVGFVERDKSKDYNIVYRNKPNKPLTVQELFGLNNKKEEIPEIEVNDKNANKEEPEIKQSESETMVNLQENKVALPEEKEINNEKKESDVKPIADTNTSNQPTPVKNTSNTDIRSNNDGLNTPNNNQGGFRNNTPNNNQGGFRNNTPNNNQGGFRNNNYNNNNNQGGFNRNNNNFGGQQGGFRNNTPNNNQGGFRSNTPNNNQGGFRSNTPNNNNQGGFRSNTPNNNQGGFRSNTPNNNQGGFRSNTPNNNQGGFRNNNYNNNGQGGYNNGGYNNAGRRPLDEKGLEKNIKNIMATDVIEKEPVREYNKSIDKQKITKYDDKTKKTTTKRKGDEQEFNEEKLKNLKQENRLSNMFNEQDGGMLDYYDLTTSRGKRNKRKTTKPNGEDARQKIFKLTEITIPETISVKDLAVELKKTSGDIIKKLLIYGIMATINNDVDYDTAYLIAEEFGVRATKKETIKEEDILFDESVDTEEELTTRPPVVVVMGHVDHGKTSLLDAIRQTNVIEGEAGGITQHIGAYQVNISQRDITFLDTPGHEAFTSMRARGAQITDIAILVVAADDGVMPQTIEAINHAKSAGIPIIVAINKIDLPGANIEKIKEELMRYELVSEEWGGDTIYVPISAKKRTNIDQLLEMVLLQADVLELKSNSHKQAKGAVIEARLDKAKGPIASVLVQRGTLDVGDTVVVGSSIGRVRAMRNAKGQKIKKAGPSTPVEIMGLTEVPTAGDIFYEVKDEKMAKHLIDRRKRQEREKSINDTSRVTLTDLFSQIEEGKLKQLNLIVKADVQGTVEAVKQSLEKITNPEVRVKVIHAAAGAVTETDVSLAKVSNAIIIAFNVRPVPTAKDVAEKDAVEIKQYSVIYKAIEDVEAAMNGMLEAKFEEKVIGTAEVRQTFKVSNVGTIAGGYVLTGKLERNAGVRVIREEVVIHEGKLSSLKRFKDDAKEVAKGYECGLQIEGYNDIKEGDIIEAFIMEEIKR